MSISMIVKLFPKRKKQGIIKTLHLKNKKEAILGFWALSIY